MFPGKSEAHVCRVLSVQFDSNLRRKQVSRSANPNRTENPPCSKTESHFKEDFEVFFLINDNLNST